MSCVAELPFGPDSENVNGNDSNDPPACRSEAEAEAGRHGAITLKFAYFATRANQKVCQSLANKQVLHVLRLLFQDRVPACEPLGWKVPC